MSSGGINLTNHFLIAMPGMAGDTFAGSVVYLCEHTEKGALGLVINKPIDIKLRNLFEKVELTLDRDDLADEPVYFGGPCRPSAASCCTSGSTATAGTTTRRCRSRAATSR
jgi:putative transcriptional regulator